MLETVGQYKILDRIGAGGLGELFRARDTHLGRTVALRQIAPEIADDSSTRAQFLEAARLGSTLSHPAIAAIYDVCEDAGRVFLAQEFIPGETLNRVIAGQALNPKRAIDYAVQMADALADAHALDVVHGHLNSRDVFITPKGKVKVADFGFGSWTRSGRASGARNDFAALGALLVEMTTGSAAGRGIPESVRAIVDRLASMTPETEDASMAIVSAELRAI